MTLSWFLCYGTRPPLPHRASETFCTVKPPLCQLFPRAFYHLNLSESYGSWYSHLCLASENNPNEKRNSSWPTFLWLLLLLSSETLSLKVRTSWMEKKKKKKSSRCILNYYVSCGHPICLDSVYHRCYLSVCLLSFRCQSESLRNQLWVHSEAVAQVIMACQSLPLLQEREKRGLGDRNRYVNISLLHRTSDSPA